MQTPERPENPEAGQRNFQFADIPHNQLLAWAQASMHLKGARLFGNEADSLIRPASLKARYSQQEVETFQEELSAGFYEIGDLSGGPLRGIRDYLTAVFRSHGFRPFDLSLTCSHMGNPEEDAVSSSPANIVKLHDEKFSTDLVTLTLLKHIGKTDSEPSANALQLEFPEHRDEGHVENLNNRLADFSTYGYTSRSVRPSLSMVLQSAIARFSSPHQLKTAATVSTEKGPNRGLITVISAPAQPIKLAVLEQDGIRPGNHYMVRELFGAKDENVPDL